jgi:Protein of unknown function (DUF2798)
MTKLPARYYPFAVPLVLSFIMSFVVSGIATLRGVGLAPDFLNVWMHAWLASWMVAFPVVLFVLPAVRRIVGMFVEEPVRKADG